MPTTSKYVVILQPSVNPKSSPIANACTQAACISKLKEETESHPEIQDFEDPGSTPADGHSTAAVSSVGTPMASSGTGYGQQQKLKLTFNGGRDGYMNGGESGMASDDD